MCVHVLPRCAHRHGLLCPQGEGSHDTIQDKLAMHKRALTANSNDAFAATAMARLLLRLAGSTDDADSRAEAHSEAEGLLRMALSERPTLAEGHLLMARLHQESGRVRCAVLWRRLALMTWTRVQVEDSAAFATEACRLLKAGLQSPLNSDAGTALARARYAAALILRAVHEQYAGNVRALLACKSI
mgnify:CR=1 FL=1